MRRSYKQNCALAHSLDMVGERWTLLIVRELLPGPKRYGELAENLPGMGTNLLAARLKELQELALIEKGAGGYQLTTSGRQLEEAVHALVRFGLAMDVPPTEGYLHRSEWDCVALAALYDRQRDTGLRGAYQVVLDDVPFCVEFTGDRPRISQSSCENPLASVSIGTAMARRLASGETNIGLAEEQGELRIRGSKEQAERLLKAFSIV